MIELTDTDIIKHEAYKREEFEMRTGKVRRVRGNPRNNMPYRATPAPGRNEPCPCGSGRKYKHCCGR